MDDYTWSRKIRARRRRRKLEWVLVLSWLALALSSVIWYYTSYTKTPSYAVNELLAAIDAADAEDFNRHVDLTAVTMRAYDDLTGDLFKYDTQLSASDRQLFENFYVLIRPQMCQGAVKVINTRVATGEWTLPEEILKGRQLGIDYDLLLERSLIRHTSIVGVENIEHLGETATAEINVVEDFSQTPFTLKVTLENFGGISWQVGSRTFELFGETLKFPGLSFTLDDNGWKIVSVDNYKEYLETLAPILQRDLDKYIDATAEIVYRYNEIFRGEQNDFIVMQRTASGAMDAEQSAQIVAFINEKIIPTLEERQRELNAVQIPNGARYLSNLRRQSTETTIQAWRFYAQGVAENNSVAFETAESVHKQELILDQRIDEIIRNAAVARNLPELP